MARKIFELNGGKLPEKEKSVDDNGEKRDGQVKEKEKEDES